MTIDELQTGISEFEDSYESGDINYGPELFTADLLSTTIDALEPPTPFCVSPDAIAEEVIMGMGARNQGCVLVTKDGVLVGIFTERDVIRKIVGKVDPKKTRISEVMTRDPEAVAFHDTVAVVLNKMTVGGFRHVPLVDIKLRPVGILSVKDLVEFFVDRFPRRVLNVSPNPAMRNPDQKDLAG
jgi:CBS domain-containing protein